MSSRIYILWLFFGAFAAASCRADWINLSGAENSPDIAEIYVYDDHVKVVLEICLKDIRLFMDILPDEYFKNAGVSAPSAADRLRSFSTNTLQFITDKGSNLFAELVMAEPRIRIDRTSPYSNMINPYTGRRATKPPDDKRVIYAELKYPFKEKPEKLTIIPPIDKNGFVQASIGFILYHKAIPVIDFRYLGTEEILQLDWSDPWYSKFDNPNLKRHHKSALMSFLYIEPYEVRHEILTRVKDLQEFLDLELRDDEYIELDELEPLKRRIGEFLLTRNKVLIDGKEYQPILDRSNYVKVSLSGIQTIEQPERLELSTAIIGVIITYITEGMPKEVTVDWDMFTDQIKSVPAMSIDPAGPLPSFLTSEDNVHTWVNYLKKYTIPDVEEVIVPESLTTMSLPVASLLCLIGILPVAIIMKKRNGKKGRGKYIGMIVILVFGSALCYPFFSMQVKKPGVYAPNLVQEDATRMLHSLLKNVYRAFDFRRENDVYDKLALTVSGDLLEEIYLQNRKSFEVRKAGGAQAKVKEVEILDVDVKHDKSNPRALKFQSTWTALGTVGHWGHIHSRKNRYEAVLTVEPVAGTWKITDLELLEEKRIDPLLQTK